MLRRSRPAQIAIALAIAAHLSTPPIRAQTEVVPTAAGSDENERRAVMVWIHDGGGGPIPDPRTHVETASALRAEQLDVWERRGESGSR